MSAPYAYVVEYRAVDACAPPKCRIDGGKAFGAATGEGGGGYVEVGTDKDELFAKRGVVLAPSRDLSFTLPHLGKGSLFDASLSAAGASGGAFRAVLEVRRGNDVVLRRELVGETAVFERTTALAELGREEKYFLHVRESLPDSDGATTISLRNEGSDALGVGAPVVLRRVEGRGPRQAFLVFFDAVPYPVFDQLYRGADAKSAWISGWVKRGTLFTQAISPGQLTGSFVRRFFRGDYYRLEGDPSLAGQGFDETPPERAPGPVARLAEQGFFTEALASNLYLSPILSRIAFDSDYNIESTIELQIHPEVLARRFAHEMEIHRDDDAIFVVWFANTHAPWREGRPDAPPFRATSRKSEPFDLGVLDPIWKNIFDSVEALRHIVESAGHPETAERVWVLASDHGHTFTQVSRDRPWRLAREAVEDGHMHCCLATAQEARTFVAVMDEGARVGPGRVVEEPISTLSVWAEIERRFGVKLELPRTSAFAAQNDEAAFDDGLFVSVGNSGALFGRRGALSYHSYEPAKTLAAAWELGPKMAGLLFGSPVPDGDILSEELYDIEKDPRETEDAAAARFGDLIAMRKRMLDWRAEYAELPDRERYQYRLEFGHQTTLSIHAPRGFTLGVDGEADKTSGPTAKASGTAFRLGDAGEPVGVVDLAGDAVDGGLVVRCAASGLPVAILDADHRRWNLSLARTNCVGEPGKRSFPPPGEAWFDARLISRGKQAADIAEVSVPELKRALMRWGYVREK